MLTFNQRAEFIRKNANKYLTCYFDSLLLDGEKVREIHLKVKKKQYERGGPRYRKPGSFQEDRTFWRHIYIRIKNQGFQICVNSEYMLDINISSDELKNMYTSNAHIKLVGVYDDINEKC